MITDVKIGRIRLEEERLNEILNAAEATLSEVLDRELYQPVKAELARTSLGEFTHSLGQRKEMFKGTIEKVFKEMKDAIILNSV